MTWRFDYRKWDGTQESLADDADAVLQQLTDDLLANGDLHEALQRMLNRGWQTPDGDQVQGLRDLLDQLFHSDPEGETEDETHWASPDVDV